VHNTRVRFDLKEFRSHYCPTGDHAVEGSEKLDRAAALTVHHANSQDCALLGDAWLQTGDLRYARKAAEILLSYARQYPDWDYRNAACVGTWSRCTHAVLGECWWVHGLVRGYDAIASSEALNAQQRATIEQGLFLTAAEDIQSHRIFANQQAEINYASGTAAINARHWYLAARAFNGVYGLKDQVYLTFSADGFSRENDHGYHFGALLPMVEQGLAYEAAGATFFTSQLKRCFDAPLAASISQQMGHWSSLYEVAYNRFRDPNYLPVIEVARGKPGRLTVHEGVVDLPAATAREFRSSVLQEAGYTVLRQGTLGAFRAVHIAWGSPAHRGGKGLLDVQPFVNDVPLTRRTLRIGYGYKQAHFPYTSIAGNVPVVDGRAQTGVRPQQVDFLDSQFSAARYLAPRSAPLFAGVRLSRTVAVLGDAFLTVDQMTSDDEHRYEIVLYPGGENVTSGPLDAAFTAYPGFAQEGDGRNSVEEPVRARMPRQFTLRYEARKHRSKQQGIATRAHLALGTDADVVKGRAWIHWHPFQTPVWFIRQTGRSALFVTVFETGDTPLDDLQLLPVDVEGRTALPHEAVAVKLSRGGTVSLAVIADVSGLKQVAGIQTERNLWFGTLP